MFNICRLCSSSIEDETNGVYIFGRNGDESKLPEILMRHYGIEIYTDHASEQICFSCWRITDDFHLLFETVQRLKGSKCISRKYDEPTDDCNVFNDMEYSAEPVTASCNLSADDIKPTDLLQENKSQLQQNANTAYVKEESLDVEVSKPNAENALLTNQQYSAQLKRKTRQISNSANLDNLAKILKKSSNKSKFEKEDQQIRDFFRMSCDFCKLTFQTMREAIRHYRISHQQAGYLICCEKKFFRRCLALDHIRLHTNPNFLQCDKCDKSYTTKFALSNHNQLAHNTTTDKPYTCHVCAASFSKKYQLGQHLRVRHVDQTNKPFGCDICGKFFVTKYVLSSHMKGVHENANARMCHICAKTFKSKKVHDLHQLEHLDHELPKLQCNICGAWLKHEDSLRKHVARHEEKEMMCKLCNKMYPSKTALGNHVRYVHSERSHRCTLCDKAFKKPVGLKEHMALHTGIDLYTCPYCPRTFKSGANMHSHRKKEHFAMWSLDREQRLSSNVAQPSKKSIIEEMPVH